MIPSQMHLLKSLFVRLVTISLILMIVLWLTPRWVEINHHKAGLLERLNRGAPGKLVVGAVQATLFPHVGIHSAEIEFWIPSTSGNPSQFLAASTGDFRISALSIFSSPKKVDFTTPRLDVRLQEIAPGKWNFFPLLGLTQKPGTPPPQPSARPKPRQKSAVEREIDQRSAQLLAGDYRPTPKPAAIQPVSTPTPFVDMKLLPAALPERNSILENLDFRNVIADRARIEIRTLAGPQLILELTRMKIEILNQEWLISGIWIKDETASWASSFQLCQGSSLESRAALRAAVNAKGISILEWKLSKSSDPWKGTISWDGEFDLDNGSNTLSGHREHFSCRKRAS